MNVNGNIYYISANKFRYLTIFTFNMLCSEKNIVWIFFLFSQRMWVWMVNMCGSGPGRLRTLFISIFYGLVS